MNLAITVLGSSAMYATAERAASGYLVQTGRANIWMDAGAGTWQNLLSFIDYEDIGGVVLSHVHPDHTTDLFQAYHARLYGGPEPLQPIPLWAPEQTIERLTSYVDGLDRTFTLTAAAAGDAAEVPGARFEFFGMEHPVATLGARIEAEGSTIAYTADSGRGGDLRSLAHGADLLLSEATFQDVDESWSGHMSASEAGAVAADAGAQQLVLTHLPPRRNLDVSLAEATQASQGIDVTLAEDGSRFEVGT